MISSTSYQQGSVISDSSLNTSSLPSCLEASLAPSTSNVSLSSLGNDSSIGHNRKPCVYFSAGKCRHGNRCRFSHDLSLTNPSSSTTLTASTVADPVYASPVDISTGLSLSRSSSLADLQQFVPPPPLIINIPPNHPIYSIDVECVATGTQHNARSIAQVALVDEWGRPVFNVLIQQEKPVVSYLTPLTGLTKEMLDTYGLPLGKRSIFNVESL